MAEKTVPAPHNSGKHRLDRAQFTWFMQDQELAENTINTYLDSVTHFFGRFSELSKGNVLAYKRMMMEEAAPATVNLRLRAIAKYAEFAGLPECAVKGVKVQQRLDVENVITEDEFKLLSDSLRQSNQKHYWIVQFLGKTGVRVSELIRLKKDCLTIGHQDLFSKGKIRRIYIPSTLAQESTEFFSEQGGGPLLFYNHSREPFTRHGIKRLLTFHGDKYGIRREAMHPHSFRHFFAKQFLRATADDIALLQDFLGHSNINTTKLYLRTSAAEKRARLDASVDW